jgi:tetratricopeptide (TPR) repeat protein
MTYVDKSMNYQTNEQIRYLRMLLNRRDLFHDLTDNGSICTLIQSRDSQRLFIWNFLWQIILGHELSWRLLIAGWTSGITVTSTFTPKLLATLIISQQWLTSVRVEKASNAREQAKRLHREAAARRARFSSLAPDAIAEECSASGTAALTAGDAMTAERCFSRALARRPRNATYRAGRAAAFVRLRSFTSAESDARTAVEADPLCGEGWAALGSARLELGKWEASVEAFEWAVDLLGEGGGGVPEAVREDLTRARRLLLEVGDLRFVRLSAEEQEKRLAEEEWKLEGCSLRFVSGVHQLQIDGLLFFAETLKWPYLDEVRVFTKDVYEKVVAGTLAIDANTWDWLYGLSLPGKYFALKICRALVGCTPSLLEMPLNGRFDAGLSLEQVSYWRVRSPLGRVLGCLPGVRSVCGWVGPCPPVHGPRSQFIRLQTRRISPLGEESADQSLFESDSPEEESIRLTKQEPMEEWAKEIQDESLWVVPEAPEQDNSVWAIRGIRLEEQPVENARSFIVGFTTPAAGEDLDIPYEAILDFEVNGSSVISFALKTNPVFVTLPSCYNASNRVHSVHQRELRKYTRNIRTLQELRLAPDFPSGPGDALVINTTGHGAETAARAWCAERGKSAAIRRSGGPCFVCAYNAVSSKGLSLQVLIWTSSADPEEVKGPCNVCKELCLEQTSSQKFRATLEDVERSADRGCSSCKLLQRGFAVADKTKPSADTSSLGQAWLSSHHYNQFAEYSFDGNWGRPDAEFRSSDRVINGAEAQGSGLCVTYAYRKHNSDRIDKVFEIDIFVDQGMTREILFDF